MSACKMSAWCAIRGVCGLGEVRRPAEAADYNHAFTVLRHSEIGCVDFSNVDTISRLDHWCE